ncbi:MAG: type I polyketide synthase [Candidatus Dactylopiibacterium sp.]|nr:type I polyketide synthase [Candidatus Dactylopiibacterium sp.]
MPSAAHTPRRVAIVGNAFRFPSTTRTRFWPDLLAARNLVTEVPADRWATDAFLHPDRAHAGTSCTFAAGTLGNVSGFDAAFFGISPREATHMDPQQRMLLEMSWEALEDAGIPPSSLRGSNCGVYLGLVCADHAFRFGEDLAVIDASSATGNTASVAANRLSYFYDWHGPSMAVDTACSSSLVAFHQACQAIRSGEISCAIAGGINLHLHPYGFLVFSKASMLSQRGLCNAFDADGDGYVRSEGGGVFFLKDYEQALADGNRILAVVAGTAVNTDGRKAGLTVPNADAQAALLRETYRRAGIAPEDIDYIEAHGTGTAIGDPLETAALGEALGKLRPAGKPLPIGSVKSNLGHLETASGVAGLVKAMMVLQHRVLPATAGIRNLNPKIRTGEWNLDIVRENRPLKAQGRLVVGINSFGFGGANAHVILESPPETPVPPAAREDSAKALPLLVSAASEAAVRAWAGSLADTLRASPETPLYDIAHRCLFGREQLGVGAALFASHRDEALAGLDALAAGGAETNCETRLAETGGPAFIYSGNGSQWFGMGRELLAEPEFLAAVQEVDQLFEPLAGFRLEDELRSETDRLALTEVAQPLLFVVQVGITCLLRASGLEPRCVAGHSVGEVTAAWAAGALTLAEAVRVLHRRSQLQGRTAGSGQMSAANIGAAQAETLLHDTGIRDVCISGINSPRSITLAGPADALGAFEQALARNGVACKRLALDYAFHSPAMEPLREAVLASLAGSRGRQGDLPFFSTVHGRELPGENLDAEYWWLNIRQPVRFEAAIQDMLAQGVRIFVEIGPHPILRQYISATAEAQQIESRHVATGSRGKNMARGIRAAVGRVALAGGRINWEPLFPHPPRPVHLPSYAWQHEDFWLTPSSENHGILGARWQHPLLGAPLAQHEGCWEQVLDTRRFPWLADHQVGSAIVFPGAGYVELALAASGEAGTEIEALEIHAPLILAGKHSHVVRTRIREDDGRFTIESREHAGEPGWTLHAGGRIVPAPGERLLGPCWPGEPERPCDADRASHLALNHRLDLNYGPAFQAVERAWIDADTALARLHASPGIVASHAGLRLHPGLLDSAFQLVAQLLRGDTAQARGLAFVPTRIERLQFRQGGMPCHALARLKRRSPHSLLAEFALFDETGTAVAVLSDVRFRAVRLSRDPAEQIHHLRDHAVPRPGCAGTAVATDSLPERLAHRFAQGPAADSLARYAGELAPLLDELCLRFTHEAFLAQAGQAAPSATQAPDSPRLARLAHRLRAAGLLDDEGRVVPATEDTPSARSVWQMLLAEYPDHFLPIHLTGLAGTALLRGPAAEPATPLPASVSPSSLIREILTPTACVEIGLALAGYLRERLDSLPHGARLAILEYAPGEPLHAGAIAGALDFSRADFRFVSTLDDAAEPMQDLRERFPAMRFDTLADVATDTPRDDIAIVTAALPPAQDMARALRDARSRLKPGGTLLIIGHTPEAWIDFCLDGTADKRFAGHRQLDERDWTAAAHDAGFEETRCLPLAADVPAGPWLLAATQPRTPATQQAPASPARHWLLLSEAHGPCHEIARRLAERLDLAGDHGVISAASDEALDALLHGQAVPPAGIVLLSGLGGDDEGIARQTRRSLLARAAAMACEARELRIPLWIVSHQARTDLLPANGGPVAATVPADAMLWGFARTLANESLAATIRLVDLARLDATDAAQWLHEELLAADDEREILRDAQGQRFATRLQRCPPARADDDATPAWQLRFSMPGQLRNLVWQAWSAPRIADDELEIAVEASGLNFRDVMYALGLLSDEALENGFAGPTLGLEFAGRVLRAGAKADFAPGERVFGFAPACLANRLVTRAACVARVPEGFSAAAAATIPTTFFTAYYALHHLAHVRPGEKVLIHGAAGGVGIAAIQIARWQGARIFASAGSDEKRDFLRLMGVDHILDSRSLEFAEDILALTSGEGVDVVLNSLSGEAIQRNFQVLRPFGRFLELGKRDFYENTHVGLRPFRNNLSYFGIDADQLMAARPDLTAQIFGEVMDLFAQGILHPLPFRAFAASEVVDAFRYMQQARQIGKIVITHETAPAITAAPTPAQPLQLAADASYLVTGGLSGFGLATAERLAERGARSMILVSRRGEAGAEASPILERLRALGVAIHARACDVSDEDALRTLLAQAARSLPPIRGIVHAAAVIEDALVRNLDPAQFERVARPKVLGAMNLHRLSTGLALDFFVLYSSATTLLGNPGQACYVAANAWLEAFSAWRRAQGLPACCVQWGGIADAGFLARNTGIRDALQSRIGGSALPARLALDELERLLASASTNVGVLELDWPALSRFLPTSDASRFDELRQRHADGTTAEADGKGIREQLAGLSEKARLDLLVGLLRAELGAILRLAPEKIAADRPIQELGMDSLMGVELVVAVEARFGVKLPVMALSESPTLERLGARLLESLGAGDEPSDETHAQPARQVQQLATQHGEDARDSRLEQIGEDLRQTGPARMIPT